MAEITLEGVSKFYGAHAAVKDLDLHVQDGELMVLVGPSGCGKSTTLRLIAGLERPSQGIIRIGGERADTLPPQRRDIAVVFQKYALYPHMTVAENMGFGLKMRGYSAAECHRQVLEAARMLQIEDLLARKPAQLSGGQQQRVAMGRAVVRRPRAFLLDEPLSNLDAQLRAELRREIGALHCRLKTTMLYVTHDQVEAMTLGDRVAVMRGGQVMQVGAPLDLYNRPSHAFVAAFIGNPGMNLLPITVQGGQLIYAGQPLGPVPKSSLPERLLLGVRPEHFTLQGGPGDWQLRGTMSATEPLGAQTQLQLAAEPVVVTARLSGQLNPALGAVLTLYFKPNHAHFFNADNGTVIS